MRWKKRYSTDLLPCIFYVLWCEPDEDFQKELFGKVIVEDDKLAKYAIWENGLKNNRNREWNKFINDLRNAPKLISAISNFQASNSNIYRFPCKLLINSIDK